MALTWARNGFWALLVLVAGAALSYGLLVGKSGPEPEELPVIAAPMVDVVVASPAVRGLSVETHGAAAARDQAGDPGWRPGRGRRSGLCGRWVLRRR